jgi:hypothetical protein
MLASVDPFYMSEALQHGTNTPTETGGSRIYVSNRTGSLTLALFLMMVTAHYITTQLDEGYSQL